MDVMTVWIMGLCALALMALEAFLPGVSAAGIVGIILIIVSVYFCWQAYGAFAGVSFLFLIAGLAVLIMRLVYRSMKSGRLSKTGIFMNEETAAAVQSAKIPAGLEAGTIGTAQTALRPAGIAEFDGERVHVLANGRFVEQGEKVKIIGVAGTRIEVEPADGRGG